MPFNHNKIMLPLQFSAGRCLHEYVVFIQLFTNMHVGLLTLWWTGDLSNKYILFIFFLQWSWILCPHFLTTLFHCRQKKGKKTNFQGKTIKTFARMSRPPSCVLRLIVVFILHGWADDAITHQWLDSEPAVVRRSSLSFIICGALKAFWNLSDNWLLKQTLSLWEHWRILGNEGNRPAVSSSSTRAPSVLLETNGCLRND